MIHFKRVIRPKYFYSKEYFWEEKKEGEKKLLNFENFL